MESAKKTEGCEKIMERKNKAQLMFEKNFLSWHQHLSFAFSWCKNTSKQNFVAINNCWLI